MGILSHRMPMGKSGFPFGIFDPRRLRVLLRLLSFALPMGMPGQAEPDAAKADEPEEPQTIEALIAEIENGFDDVTTPGMSLAIVTRDEVLHAGGLGLANVAADRPATADTLFRIASVSKGFTALAALKLRAEGRLDFSATLAELAPKIDFENKWEEDAPVRISHLLTHTSGFDEIHFRDYANPDIRPDNLLDALNYTPAWRKTRWRPGTRYGYINGGPALIAHVVEEITGMRFEDYVHEEIFIPIGMRTATYFRPEDDDQITRLYKADGTTPHDYLNFALRPFGSANASANDMAAYLGFLLNRGQAAENTLLAEADILEMESPGPTGGSRAGLTTGPGLYSMIFHDDDGRVWHGHDGHLPGALSEMAYQPESGIGYAINLNGNDVALLWRTRYLVKNFLTRNLPKPDFPPEIPIDEPTAGHFEGYYVLDTPRSNWSAFWESVVQTCHLSIEGGRARFGQVFGNKTEYLGVTATLLRRENQGVPGLALIEHPAPGESDLYTITASYRKVPAIVAFTPHAISAGALLGIVSCIFFFPVWVIRALLKKIDWRDHLGLRLWPLVAALAIISWGVSFMLSLQDPEFYAHYGFPTPRSVLVCVLSIGALVMPCIGLAVTVRHRGAPRVLRAHAIIVLTSLVVWALMQIYAGMIPYVSWV